MLEARRYRLRLTSEQDELAQKTVDCCRALYNAMLEQRKMSRSMGFVSWEPDPVAELPELKKTEGFEWLAEVSASCLQQVFRDLDRSYKNFWAGRARSPRYKRKSRSGGSFRCVQIDRPIRKLNRHWAEARLPKLGWCRFKMTRPIDGKIRYATVKSDAQGWHVIFCVDTDRQHEKPNGGPGIGLDRGVTVSVAASDGAMHHVPGLPPGQAERLCRLRRRAGRQETGRRHRPNDQRKRSRRHQRTLDAKAKLEARETRIKNDFLHKLTHGLTKSHGLIAIEDLNTRGMTKSARGTADEPGRNVSQKRGLNRAILSSGWGELRRQLDYKTVWYGSELALVDPRFTSQTCADCGVVDAGSRDSQARFCCVACGHEDNADTNAARVILARAFVSHEDRRQDLSPQRAEPSCEEARLGSANLPTARAV